MDGGGAVTDKARDVVRGPRLGRLRDDGGSHAEADGDEVVVDRTHSDHRRDVSAPLREPARQGSKPTRQQPRSRPMSVRSHAVEQ